MATFFGEILPIESRAFDYDYDDDDDSDEEEVPASNFEAIIRWSPAIRREIEDNTQNCLQCSILIAAIGPAATAFIRTYVLESKSPKIGVICTGLKSNDINSMSQNAATDKTCYIYRLTSRPEVIVALCNTDVSPEQSYSWTHNLMDKMNVTNVYAAILCTNPVADYKSQLPPGDVPTPFLRALKTTKFRGTPTCPYLEQPNMITGLPAQIMSYCEVFKIAAVMYVCYTDSKKVDKQTISMYKDVLSSTPLKDVALEKPNEDEIKYDEMHTEYENLYM